MSGYRIEFRGLKEYDAKLGRIESQMPDNLKKLMVKSIIYAQGQIPSYPSPPAGSTYRRTGTLGRVVTAFPGVHGGRSLGGGGGDNGGTPLTRVEMMGGGVRGVVGGRLKYLPYVVDEDAQAYMHRGRWWTLQSVIKGATRGIVSIFRGGVLDLFK